jgi:hypothetical protein
MVRDSSDRPRITTRPDELGHAALSAARRGHSFDPEDAAWPEVATLEVTMPKRPARPLRAAELRDQGPHRRRDLQRPRERVLGAANVVA